MHPNMSLQPILRALSHARLAALLTAALALAACGGAGYVEVGYDDPYYYPYPYVAPGTVVAENDTATVPETVMWDFFLWHSGDAPSDVNLLTMELFPGEWEVVATVDPDYYDADALMSDGIVDYLETWFGIYVEGGLETTFFAY